jgi:hypothetical protein
MGEKHGEQINPQMLYQNTCYSDPPLRSIPLQLLVLLDNLFYEISTLGSGTLQLVPLNVKATPRKDFIKALGLHFHLLRIS